MSALTDATNTLKTETETVDAKNVVVEASESAEAEVPTAEVAEAENPTSEVTEAESPTAEATEAENPTSEVTEAEAPTAEATEAENPTSEATEAAETVETEVPMEEVTEAVVEETNEEKQKKLDENLIAGRRFMKTSAFDKATEVLSTAAALSAELFGEGHEQTFEVTFLYGQSLLELAKIEDEVLTNALTDIPKTGGDDEPQDDVVENPENVPQEEREEIKQQVEEALGVASDEKVEMETSEAVEQTETTPETSEAVVEEAEKAEDVEMETAEEEEQGQAVEEEEGSDGEAEDEDDPMKLAWELLETARCICEKKIKALEEAESVDTDAVKTWSLNHADVLTSLGEHGVADSKYDQAQKDLAAALALQSTHLSTTSRLLANTNHLLGKAFSCDALFETAATHFSNAKNILIAKSEELKAQLAAVTEDGEAKTSLEAEIKEIDELIPELDALVVDARASAEQTEKIKETAKKELEGVAATIAKLAGEEVQDITSLVRRPTKRSADETVATEEVVKKRKSEEGTSEVTTEQPMEEATETTTA